MYKRVLLKLSGEAMAGDDKNGINFDVVDSICEKIVELSKNGIQVGVVTGGGNFWRGYYGANMEKVTSHYMGMLATVINSLALKDALIAKGVKAVVQTSISMIQIAEPYTKRDMEKHFDEGCVVIFGGGTGLPFFSTDTSADPKIDPNAIKYDEITYDEVLKKNLKVMDSPAIALCRDNNIPLLVFELKNTENIVRAAKGENIGTIVK